MSEYGVINKDILVNIADRIRKKTCSTEQIRVSQLANKIKDIQTGLPINIELHIGEDGEWERPNDYPNLDSISDWHNEEFEGVYLTYKVTDYDADFISLNCLISSGEYTIEQGHIEGNAFIVDYTYNCSSNSYVTQRIVANNNEKYVVFRVKPVSGHITRFSFGMIATSYSGKSIAIPYNDQFCVERVGRLPYVTTLTYSDTSWGYGTIYLERDAVVVGKNANTVIAGAWYNCYSLQKLEVSDWDTANWTVSSLESTWYLCYNLQNLDLSNWNTSKWIVNNLRSTWYGCQSMRTLDVSTWNTSTWNVSSLYATWHACRVLQSLDLSTWNTTNWRLSTLSNTWHDCYSLQSLDLSTWNTTNWRVTTLANAWGQCFSLQNLEISDWNTLNWAVTTLSNTWYYCYSLQSLDLSTWNTTNWRVTTLANIWYNCYHLQNLDLSTWDTTNWAVTDLSNAWNNCYSLQNLDLSTWDTTNWAVTTLANTWHDCYSLQSLDLSTWNTTNWKVTTLSYTWGYCSNLYILNLSGWDTTNCAVTTLANTLYCNTNLKILNLSGWGPTPFTTQNNNTFTSVNCIKDYYPPCFKFSHDYSGFYQLSHESVLRIINSLPQTDSPLTLTLGNLRVYLTTADIAVATSKGWSIA